MLAVNFFSCIIINHSFSPLERSDHLFCSDDLRREIEHRGAGDVTALLSKEGTFCKDLYFVTKNMPLDNVPSKAFSILLHRIATGEEFDEDLSRDEPLEALRVAMTADRQLTSTSQMLKMFLVLGLYNQVIVVSDSFVSSATAS